MTQIATVEKVLAGGYAEISVPRKSACGHDCEECAGCGVTGAAVHARARNAVGRPARARRWWWRAARKSSWASSFLSTWCRWCSSSWATASPPCWGPGAASGRRRASWASSSASCPPSSMTGGSGPRAGWCSASCGYSEDVRLCAAAAWSSCPEEEQRALPRRMYCGLCRCLGQRCGQGARMILNYDFTYLAILLSGGGAGEEREGRCLPHPVKAAALSRAHPGHGARRRTRA